MRRLMCMGLLGILLTASAMAQDCPIGKGSMVLGGSAYIRNNSGDLYWSRTYGEVTPVLGLFISKGIFFGGEILFAYEKIKHFKDSYWYGLGPVFGYYFDLYPNKVDFKGAIYPYVKGKAVFKRTGQYTLKCAGGEFGMDLMLSNTVALDVGIRASYDFIDKGSFGVVSGSDVGASLGIVAFL